MRPSSMFLLVLCLLALVPPSVTSARGPESRSGTPDLEKESAKLKAESAAAWKKLRRASRKSEVKTAVKVVSVKGINSKELVRALKKIYRRTPGFALAALPSVRCLIIRADEKTMEEVLRIINGVSPIG